MVVGLVLLGVAAAVLGIWFQRQQTRRCLAFYGADVARLITTSPSVQLLAVREGDGPRRLVEVARIDVTRAPGLVHLRRGLVEDANFRWGEEAAGADATPPLPIAACDAALVFAEPGGQATLVLDLDGSRPAAAVVGRPGRIGLGRITVGLNTWINDVWRRESHPLHRGRAAAETGEKIR